MSATLRLRNALVRDGSAGGSRVTPGLSSVGPPPTLRINQPLWNLRMTGSRWFTTSAPKTSRYHSREVSWSRTTRKWVTITPWLGAGKSSRFIVSGSFPSGSVILTASQALEVALAVADSLQQRGHPLALVEVDRVAGEQAAMLARIPKEDRRPARVS